jgi:putative lipoprotein
MLDHYSQIIVCLLLLACLLSPIQQATAAQNTRTDTLIQYTPAQDKWFAKDKADHLIVSAFLTGMGYYAAQKEFEFNHRQSKTFAVGFSISLGLLKETYDGLYKKTKFSFKDLVADLAGIGLALIIIDP